MKQDENGKNIVDQEKVNELVDYAIEHGINYFDTAPVYLQGQSETATGLALKRHPRDKFVIATKMSNFGVTDFEGMPQNGSAKMIRLRKFFCLKVRKMLCTPRCVCPNMWRAFCRGKNCFCPEPRTKV